MTTFYITKYALTSGIEQRDDMKASSAGDEFLWDGRNIYYIGKDAHAAVEGAVARAEQMRVAKIASLKKQIAKLEKLSFSEAV